MLLTHEQSGWIDSSGEKNLCHFGSINRSLQGLRCPDELEGGRKDIPGISSFHSGGGGRRTSGDAKILRCAQDDKVGGEPRMTAGMVDFVVVDEHQGCKDPSLSSE